jgi:hypothetical protein
LQQKDSDLISLASADRLSQVPGNKLNMGPEMESLRRLFSDAGRVAVRIPVTVQQKDGHREPTYFDAFIERAEGSLQKRPVFIRDGIVISDVRTRAVRDVNAIVSINDAPLTALLGDAENPAHTEWNEESSHFKGKYQNGAATLRFVRNSVADLCHSLTESAADEDPVLLLDVFSLGATGGQTGLPVSFPSMSSKGAAPHLLRLKALSGRPRKSKPFQLSGRQGGFKVAGRQGIAQICSPLDVFVAYDRRSGSPLRKYSTTDFRLDAAPVLIKAQHAIIQIAEPNHLMIYPQRPDFNLIVTGFDLNRDLFVQVRASAQENMRQRRAG